jgi:hypothetical protein
MQPWKIMPSNHVLKKNCQKQYLIYLNFGDSCFICKEGMTINKHLQLPYNYRANIFETHTIQVMHVE